MTRRAKRSGHAELEELRQRGAAECAKARELEAGWKGPRWTWRPPPPASPMPTRLSATPLLRRHADGG
jgi:hypothetical protein